MNEVLCELASAELYRAHPLPFAFTLATAAYPSLLGFKNGLTCFPNDPFVCPESVRNDALHQSLENMGSCLACPPIKAELILTEITPKIFAGDRALVRSEQPSLQ